MSILLYSMLFACSGDKADDSAENSKKGRNLLMKRNRENDAE